MKEHLQKYGKLNRTKQHRLTLTYRLFPFINRPIDCITLLAIYGEVNAQLAGKKGGMVLCQNPLVNH